MQSMRFLILGKDGKPANHGEILREITSSKYLCHFAATPSYSRVCDIEEVQNWLLFPDDTRMNAFILALRRQEMTAAASKAAAEKAAAESPDDPVQPPVKQPKKKVVKKKAKKKKVTKKTVKKDA